MTDYPGLATWRLTGEHGRSSLATANRLRFATVATHTDHPYDPADFRRCELLLRAVPTMRRDLHHMASTGDVTGHGIVTRIDCPESECPTCTEEAPNA